MGIYCSSARYLSYARSGEADTVTRTRECANEQPIYGYPLMAAVLKHYACDINRRRIYRILRQEGLQLPRRKPLKRRLSGSTDTLRQATNTSGNQIRAY